jgi:hypothetical protein
MIPELSLAVAAHRADRVAIERFIAALDALPLDNGVEVELAASPGPGVSAGELTAALRSRPGLTLSVESGDTTPMRLWGVALARARGEWVAVLDVRDRPDPDWLRSWRAAPRDCVVCGSVEPSAMESVWDRAAYLSEYGQFLSPLEPDQLEEIPGNNLVLPRSWLPDSEGLRRDGFWKTFHLEQLRRERGALPVAAAPGMSVRLAHRYTAHEYLHRKLLHGRCYGGSRLQQPGSPPRLLCIAFAPLLPGLRLFRLWRRAGRRALGRIPLISAMPAVVLGEIAWSFGEFLGYAFGCGSACEQLW